VAASYEAFGGSAHEHPADPGRSKVAKHVQRLKPWFRLIVEKGEGESGDVAGAVFRHQEQRAGLGESLANFGQLDASV
jgi:hypothetical protein